MSTLFSKIKPIGQGGIPGEVRKINECVERINWLCGIHTINGLPMSDTSTGPVIDLSLPPPGAQPWLIDPNGNPAGWAVWNVCISGTSTPVYFWGQIFAANGTLLPGQTAGLG
jgi:hypothetical protein